MYSSVQMDVTDENTLMQELNTSPHSSPARTPDTPNNSCINYSQPSSAEEGGDGEVNEVGQQSQLAQQQDEEKAVEAQPESEEEKAVEAQPESDEEKAVEAQPKPVKEEAVEAESKPIKTKAQRVRVAVEVPHKTKPAKQAIYVPRGFTQLALPPDGVSRSYGKSASGLSVAAADRGGAFFFDHMPAKNVQKYIYFLIKDSRSDQTGIITTANNTCLDFQSLAGCEYHKCTKFHTSLAAIVSCLPNSPHGPPIVLGMLSIIMQKHKMLEKQRFEWSKAELHMNKFNQVEKQRKLMDDVKKMEEDNALLFEVTKNQARYDAAKALQQAAQRFKEQQNQGFNPAPIALQPQQLLAYQPYPKHRHVSDASNSDSDSEELRRAMKAYKKRRLAIKQAKKENACRREVKESKNRRRSRSNTPDKEDPKRSKSNASE